MHSIPMVEEPERYTQTAFRKSGFVEVRSNHMFEVAMQYPLLHMENAEGQCFVREEVYQILLKAYGLLPKGYRFKILDAWRPFALQEELYRTYSEDIIKEFQLTDCNEQQKQAAIRRFVSEPVPDQELPPVHTTGGAVDLTLLDEYGRELDMGTGFDAFTEKTHTAYFENDTQETFVRENRRLLYCVMTEAGFTNLPSEWWHYDYGDRFWAYYKHAPAIYRGVFTREELNGKGYRIGETE